MEVDVKIAGASYSGVPAVLLPLADGGKARFCEVSDTTAVASDVAAGKKFYSANGTLTTGTASGSSRTSGGASIPTYTLTIPESEHQSISIEVGCPEKKKTLTASGTASLSNVIGLNPYILAISQTVDDGYTKGTLTPSLTLPYEITQDIAFSVTDATVKEEETVKIVLGAFTEGQNASGKKYKDYTVLSQNPESPKVGKVRVAEWGTYIYGDFRNLFSTNCYVDGPKPGSKYYFFVEATYLNTTGNFYSNDYAGAEWIITGTK